MDLINSLVAADYTALNTLCLVGILPAAFRLASPAQSRPLRRKAALFQHVCCHSSMLMLRMVVMCQVRPSAVQPMLLFMGLCLQLRYWQHACRKRQGLHMHKSVSQLRFSGM